MNRNAAALVEHAGAFAHALDRVTAARLGDDASSDGLIRLASDMELLRALTEVSHLMRLAEAERVKLAGEVHRRSEIGDGSSLARRMGETSATALVAKVAEVPGGHATTLVQVGEQIRPREALSGEVLAPQHPHIAEALAAGTLPLPVADGIRRCIARVTPVLSAAELLELERQLVEKAAEGWRVDDFLAYLRRAVDHIDQDGVEQREETLAAKAQVTERRLDNGLLRFILDVDPLTGGFFKTAMDANASLRRARFVDGDEAEAAHEQQDRRPLKQRRVDAIRLLAKKALKVDDGDVGGTAVTMLVTIDEQSLRDRVGSATILSTGEIISAATARMLAVDAEILPIVLGGNSQPLDIGTGRRYFTEAQRRAMAVRDGGCAGPGCTAPPSACDGAHIRPAGWGRTSIENGILLCWRCHLLLDKQGWQVEREAGRWWWGPPPWVDPTGRRRPGGTIAPPQLDVA